MINSRKKLENIIEVVRNNSDKDLLDALIESGKYDEHEKFIIEICKHRHHSHLKHYSSRRLPEVIEIILNEPLQTFDIIDAWETIFTRITGISYNKGIHTILRKYIKSEKDLYIEPICPGNLTKLLRWTSSGKNEIFRVLQEARDMIQEENDKIEELKYLSSASNRFDNNSLCGTPVDIAKSIEIPNTELSLNDNDKDNQSNIVYKKALLLSEPCVADYIPAINHLLTFKGKIVLTNGSFSTSEGIIISSLLDTAGKLLDEMLLAKLQMVDEVYILVKSNQRPADYVPRIESPIYGMVDKIKANTHIVPKYICRGDYVTTFPAF